MALLLLLTGFLVGGTLHVFTLAHVTLVQFGDTFTVGSPLGMIMIWGQSHRTLAY